MRRRSSAEPFVTRGPRDSIAPKARPSRHCLLQANFGELNQPLPARVSSPFGDVEMRTRSTLAIVMAALTALLPNVSLGTHACRLNSTFIELTLLILTPLACSIWTARAHTNRNAWLRVFLSFAISMLLQCSYQSWLHSRSFPNILLSQSARDWKQKITDARQQWEAQERSSSWHGATNIITQPPSAPHTRSPERPPEL